MTSLISFRTLASSGGLVSEDTSIGGVFFACGIILIGLIGLLAAIIVLAIRETGDDQPAAENAPEPVPADTPPDNAPDKLPFHIGHFFARIGVFLGLAAIYSAIITLASMLGYIFGGLFTILLIIFVVFLPCRAFSRWLRSRQKSGIEAAKKSKFESAKTAIQSTGDLGASIFKNIRMELSSITLHLDKSPTIAVAVFAYRFSVLSEIARQKLPADIAKDTCDDVFRRFMADVQNHGASDTLTRDEPIIRAACDAASKTLHGIEPAIYADALSLIIANHLFCLSPKVHTRLRRRSRSRSADGYATISLPSPATPHRMRCTQNDRTAGIFPPSHHVIPPCAAIHVRANL